MLAEPASRLDQTQATEQFIHLMPFALIATLSMLVVLGIMVLVHEAGHFITAKLCGVRVEVFSIGFGNAF